MPVSSRGSGEGVAAAARALWALAEPACPRGRVLVLRAYWDTQPQEGAEERAH